MLGVVVVFLCTLCAVYHIFFHQKTNWPPGPRALPLLGNILQFDKAGAHHTLRKWVKTYGDIYRIKLFYKDVIVISGAEEIRDATIKYSEEFGGRPSMYRLKYMFGEDEEHISMGNGQRCKMHKKLAINAMKAYGEGLKVLEHIIQDILEEVTATLVSKVGQALDPGEIIIAATNDIIALAVYGHRLPESMRKEYPEFEEKWEEFFGPEGSEVLLDFIPLLRYLPNKIKDKMLKLQKTYNEIADWMIEEGKASFDVDQPSCVLHHYLCMQPTMMDEEGKPLYTDINIKSLTMEMMFAGTSTTYSTLIGFVAICVSHPDIQERIQKQINDVIGNKRPKLADRESLPLVEAAILETLRYLSQIPFLLPHMTTVDVEFHGYTIPKNTEVWLNSWSLHHDERFWDEPWSFRPERFLDNHGQLLPPDHPTRRRLLPFGAGRRVCPGEVFAKNRLFLFITSLLQQFSFLPVEGAPLPQCDPRQFGVSLAMRPEKYKISVVQKPHGI